MSPPRSARSGVTLIELLLAVTLLSLLSAGILLAMRVGLNAMEKSNAKLMANRRVVRTQQILEQQIAGFIPLVAHYYPAPNAPAVRMPFFHGEPQSMRFLSSYSLGEAARGYPRILEFQVIPGEQSRGVRLIVNEHLYTGPQSAGVFCLGFGPDPLLGVPAPLYRPIEAGPGSFVLADRLAYCRFWYREMLLPPASERWVPRWVLRTWPSAVRIEMAPLEPDASRLLPLTLTAPLRVSRSPFLEYAD